MATVISNVRLFDGDKVLDTATVVVDGPTIRDIGRSSVEHDAAATYIDGTGCMLLPGLIDAHVHTGGNLDSLKLALTFGVTTELEMMGHFTAEQRALIAQRDDIADVRTAEFGLTAPGGHPAELHKAKPKCKGHHAGPDSGKTHGREEGTGFTFPTAQTLEEAVDFVKDRINDGADYIKLMIEEGSILQAPNLPVLSADILTAAVKEAHRHGKLAIAHAMTYEATETALSVGVDGLAHIFIDRLGDESITNKLKAANAFVVPCLTLNSSIIGHVPEAFARDPRVHDKLPEEWRTTLKSCFNTYREGKVSTVAETVFHLHKAGIDIIAGTDASIPFEHLGGLAHGASLHHELQMLVEAGLTPVEALRSATSVTARRFGLDDRGRIEKGLRADLLLVEGDPSTKISDTLSIRGVWRRGQKLEAKDI